MSHPDQVKEERRFKHPVQSHFLIVEQVFQAASSTVLCDNAKYARIQEQAQKQVQILMAHISEL